MRAVVLSEEAMDRTLLTLAEFGARMNKAKVEQTTGSGHFGRPRRSQPRSVLRSRRAGARGATRADQRARRKRGSPSLAQPQDSAPADTGDRYRWWLDRVRHRRTWERHTKSGRCDSQIGCWGSDLQLRSKVTEAERWWRKHSSMWFRSLGRSSGWRERGQAWRAMRELGRAHAAAVDRLDRSPLRDDVRGDSRRSRSRSGPCSGDPCRCRHRRGSNDRRR